MKNVDKLSSGILGGMGCVVLSSFPPTSQRLPCTPIYCNDKAYDWYVLEVKVTELDIYSPYYPVEKIYSRATKCQEVCGLDLAKMAEASGRPHLFP